MVRRLAALGQIGNMSKGQCTAGFQPEEQAKTRAGASWAPEVSKEWKGGGWVLFPPFPVSYPERHPIIILGGAWSSPNSDWMTVCEQGSQMPPNFYSWNIRSEFRKTGKAGMTKSFTMNLRLWKNYESIRPFLQLCQQLQFPEYLSTLCFRSHCSSMHL